MRCGCFALCACVAATVAVGAVRPGENLLLNGKLEADQVDFPPFWNASKELFRWHPSGGPDGLPYVSVCGEKADSARMKQFGLNLASNGLYRMSMKVRTKDLAYQHPSGLIVVNNGLWVSTAGIMDLPRDTGGEWKPISADFTCFASEAGYYAMVYVKRQKGVLEVADLKLEAVDALALRETGESNLLAAQSRPRLVPVSPLLAKIPEDDPAVTFRFFGKLEGKDADYEVVAVAEGSREKVRVALSRGDMKVSLPAGAKKGEMIVGVVHKSTRKQAVKSKFRFATVPACPQPPAGSRRRLNNLVTEVLAADLKSAATNELEFVLSRDGWTFIALQGAGNGTALLDGAEVVSSTTPRQETFRLLSAGRHVLAVAGAAGGRAVVREIAEILNYCPGVNSGVKENPPYDWNFQERYVLPAVTTQLGGSIPGNHYQDFRRRGYRWFANMGLTGGPTDVMIAKLSACEGLNKSWYAGTCCDEQNYANVTEIDDYARGFWAFDIEKKPSRPVYSWIYGKSAVESVGEDVCSACFNISGGTGKILSEIYCRSRATETEARQFLRTYVGDTMDCYRGWNPSWMSSLGVVFGNFNQVPILSIAHHPETDYKYYLDMQLNFAANDPSCRGLGLIGYWGSYYADEELHRWSFALMRHYAVEGATNMLSAAYGFRHNPDHILNGDFRGTLAPWKVSGSVRAESQGGFGSKNQNRWGGNDGVGDTFATLVRDEGAPASLTQVAKGLVPGRKYCLQFATFDVKDVRAFRIAPRRFGVEARLSDGAEVDKELSWTHVDERIKGRYAINDGVARINLHHIVFTAKAGTVEIALDNAVAAPGEELGINFVSLNPYFERK